MGIPRISTAMAVHLDGLAAVLGKEGLLEAGLAADEVPQVMAGGHPNDGSDRAAHAHLEATFGGHEVAHAGQRGELLDGDGFAERELDLVMRKVAERLDPVDLDDPTVADDRDAVAGLLDFAEDVGREERAPALRDGLAQQLEERLLDERVQA